MIFANLASQKTPPLIEVHGQRLVPTTSEEFHELIDRARAFLEKSGVRPGDRVALLAPNSVKWVACDLAILASGAISVPLYHRQDPKELVFMANDCQPKLLIASNNILVNTIRRQWSGPLVSYDEIFRTSPRAFPLHSIRSKDPVTIVYTSGTSGNPKGAVINCGNIDYMLEQTTSRLRMATGRNSPNDRVFHYLPVCFMGSRIMLWTQLYRGNPLMLSTDISNLAEEIGTANPEYFLNVPTLLERIRSGVTQKTPRKRGARFVVVPNGASLSIDSQKYREKHTVFDLRISGALRRNPTLV